MSFQPSKILPSVRIAAPSAKFLKGCTKISPSTTIWAPGENPQVASTVNSMLKKINIGKEKAAISYATKFDNWPTDKPVLLTTDDIEQQTSILSDKIKADIRWQLERVRRFAQAQRNSVHDFELDIGEGVTAGQRLVPVTTVGCYVPGGRFSHISSAIMTVATAKVAGVPNVIACSPPMKGTTKIHPATLYAMQLAGADHILVMGGVQAIASLAYGLFTGIKADMIVGPGNAYVAEAKRILFGSVGIDLFAGPTEIAVIADESADARLVATDLISQAEHGINSPAWLITTSENLGREVIRLMDEFIDDLCNSVQGNASRQSWKEYGEVILVASREEACALSDIYAPEHLEVLAKDLRWWLANLKNYGSLFLGEETCVTYGDKTSGPNHVLPTKGAAKYSGGLSVHKFLKPLTWQIMDRIHPEVAVRSARISRLEGMEGHARSGDIRLLKYFPGQNFELHPPIITSKL